MWHAMTDHQRLMNERYYEPGQFMHRGVINNGGMQSFASFEALLRYRPGSREYLNKQNKCTK